MKSRKTRFASILLSLVLALGLMPSPAMATGADTGARNNAMGNRLQASSIEQPITTQATDGKQQAIQVASMSVFKTEKGKKVSAQVVEGDGALSYAVKTGSQDYIDVDASSGALTIKAVPPDNKAYVTVTAAETSTYKETPVDVPIKIYDKYEYEISLWTVQYAIYNSVYNLSSLDIKLFDKGGNAVGSATVQNPRYGNKVTVPATNFADRVEMTAHIQLPKRDPFTLTGSGGIGGSIDVWNKTSRSGKVFTCNYGMNAPEPEYTAPVAKANLIANGDNQILIYPGSVSVGGVMQYCLGTESKPNNNWSGLGYIRKKDPGTYYVWWRTHNTDYYTARYIGQGRSEMSPQCIAVTIGKGAISPTVDIEGWTHGEEPKTPTVTGNTGNGEVTYEYKAKGAADDTYTMTVPTDAGDYTVRATIADTASYSGGTATKDFTIAKAKVPQQEVRVAGLIDSVDSPSPHWEAGITQPLAGMMPNDGGTLTYEAGAPKYADGSSALPTGVTSFTSSVDSDGVVTAKLEIPSTATGIPEGVREITLPVTVKSQKNYEDSTINVVVVPTEREEKTVTIGDVPASKTYGDDAFTLTATVTGVETGAKDWYWYSSNPDVLEVNAENGSGQMLVHVKGAGSAQILAWYEPSDGDTIGAALTDPITVNKATISPIVSIEGWTYGDAAKTPTVTGNAGNGTVTYSYSGTTLSGTSFGPSATAPTQAGNYTVTATVAETANYLGGTTGGASFGIAPKSVPVTVIAEDKTYDGSADVNVTAAMRVSDLVDGDLLEGTVVNEDGTVAFPGLTGTFADANAGQNKRITLNGNEVAYPVADPWSYEAKISEPSASILPRPVYVKADDKTSRHGEDLAELTYSGLIYSQDGSASSVDSDTLASLGITASTTASSSSSVGEYPITLSGGTANSNYDVYFVEGGTYTITQGQKMEKSIRVAGLLASVDGPPAHWEANITQSLAGMMPDGAEVLSYEAGAPTYADGTTTLPEAVASFTSNVDSSTGEVTAKLEIPSSSSATDIPEQVRKITLPVTVRSKNYEDSTVNVVVEPTRKKEKTVTIGGIPTSKTYGDDAFTLTATVKDGDNVVETKEGDWYWYSSDPSVLEVPAIADSNAGSSAVTVTVRNPGSAQILAWYEPSDGDTIGAAVTDPITVGKKSISPSVSIEGWTYGEAPKAPVLAAESNPGGCTVTYEYKAKGADDSIYSEDVPTQAGEYTVRATVPESTYYQGATCMANFTIGKIPVYATVTAKNKTYDGKANANVSATVSEGVLEGDVVKIVSLSGAFDNPNAGDNKRINLDASSMCLAGEGSSNYEVKLPSDPIASSILRRHIYVKADDKSSQYGKNIAALTYSLYGSTTLVKGDTLKSLGITARTTATSRSNAGSYRITLSGGTANPNYDVTLNTKAGKYTINKASNTLKVTPKTAKVAKSKKVKTIKRAKALTVSKAMGKLTYKKLSGNKKITVDPKNGNVKVKGGLKKNTYQVRVKVTAAGNKNYKSGSRTVTFKVKVN